MLEESEGEDGWRRGEIPRQHSVGHEAASEGPRSSSVVSWSTGSKGEWGWDGDVEDYDEYEQEEALSGEPALLPGDSGRVLNAMQRRPWVQTKQAKYLFGSIIMLNALVLGLDVEADLRGHPWLATACYVQQCIFAIGFVIELLLRFKAEPQVFCRNMDGFSDTFVMLITLVDLFVLTPLVRFAGIEGLQSLEALSMLRVLQLLRLVRILRLLRVSRQLSLLVLGLAQSFRSVMWVFVMLFAVIYIGAVFCASELGKADNDDLKRAFGSIWYSMYSHFKIMTLEAWPDICGWAMEQHPLWALYFITYILIANLVLVNLITGLVMDGVLQSAKKEDWTSELMVVEAKPFVETLRSIVRAADHNADDSLDQDEFEKLLSEPFLQDVLEAYGISLRIEPKDLFHVLDVRGQGSLGVEELAGSLLRLRGSRDSLHPLLVRHDLHRETKKLIGSLKSCERRVVERYDAELRDLEQKLCAKLERVAPVARVEATCAPVKSELVVDVQSKCAPAVAEQALQADAKEPTLVAVAVAGEAQHAEPVEQACSPRERPAEAPPAERMLKLLQEATARVRLLDEAINKAEVELQASLAKEAALEAELVSGEVSRGVQTGLFDEEGEKNEEAEPPEPSGPPPEAEGSSLQEKSVAYLAGNIEQSSAMSRGLQAEVVPSSPPFSFREGTKHSSGSSQSAETKTDVLRDGQAVGRAGMLPASN
mmetsp:Transcript_44602/g.103119  ORF Transcript_44602/g.103119 Transcript_44602/m.103119 type:complete len:708 (-) Transcript_44602:176-2299(-)